MKKRMFQAQREIDRQIKRPIEFRIFYWMGLIFLFIQTLVYSGAAFQIDALTDLSHRGEDTDLNYFVRLLILIFVNLPLTMRTLQYVLM